jgi:hypothetical protein
MRLDEGTMVCCFDLKKSRNDWRTCDDVIMASKSIQPQTARRSRRILPRQDEKTNGIRRGEASWNFSKGQRCGDGHEVSPFKPETASWPDSQRKIKGDGEDRRAFSARRTLGTDSGLSGLRSFEIEFALPCACLAAWTLNGNKAK